MAKIDDNPSKNLYNLTIKGEMAMKIEVKNLLNQPEGSVESYPLEIVDLPIDETKAHITGEAMLTNLDDFVLANVTGQAIITEPCSRCLKEVDLTIPLKFSREFKIMDSLRHSGEPLGRLQNLIYDPGRGQDDEVRKTSSVQKDDGETYPIVDGEINLAPPLTEEIIANIPIKVLCRENCQGLCPKCGANLNDNPCKCDKVKDEISNKIKF